MVVSLHSHVFFIVVIEMTMQIAVSLLLLLLSSELVMLADGLDILKGKVTSSSQRWIQMMIHGTSSLRCSNNFGRQFSYSIAAVVSTDNSGGIVESLRPSRIDSSVMNSADVVCEWDLPSVTAATSDMEISKEITELLVQTNASVSHLKFSRALKHVASQRLLSLSRYDRFLLVQSVVRFLRPMDRSSLSHCVWALGVLGVNVGDFSPTHVQQSSLNTSTGIDESRRPSKSNVHKLYLDHPNLISLMKKVDECYSIVDGKYSTSSDDDVVDLLRTTSGLSKLGLRWVDLSPALQRRFLRLTFDLGQPLSGRELASALYVLGQLDVDKTALSTAYVQSLLGCLLKDETLGSLTSQGLTNAMHGLSRMGFQWSDLLVDKHGSEGTDDVSPLQLKLLQRSEVLLPLARTDELCSYLNSLAVMQFHLPSSCCDPSAGDLSLSLRSVLLECLSSKLDSFSRRELVNVMWALGQIDFRCNAAPSSYEWEGFIGPLLDRVESAVLVPTMTAFDMESLLVGLDLLQVQLRTHSQWQWCKRLSAL